MKIIDSFMYFDENMMLDLRLNILNKYIHKFVVCEATYNHNGDEKKLNFDIKNFSKFRSKIEYIVLDQKPPSLKTIEKEDSEEKKESKTLDNALARENFQRNFVSDHLSNYADEDLILINDLDEIPDLKNFRYKKKITVFLQMMLYYKFNLVYPNILWPGSKICKKKDLLSPQWLRNVKTKKYSKWRPDLIFSKKKYNNINIIQNGGWHFTNIKTPKEIHHKMKNFLHHFEYNESGLNVKDIENLIKNKKALYNYSVDQKEKKWDENSYLREIEIDLLPEYLIQNKSNYKNWLN